MTGRPSGRCAATEALESLLAWAERFRGGDASLSSEEWYIARDFARIALASPCCVSATDQEQVKEALTFAAAAIENFSQAYPESYYAEDGRDCLTKFVLPALALLGSNEEEEQ